MSALDYGAALAIAGMAIATYITRVAGLWLFRGVVARGRTRAALDALPAAILMAIIAPQVLTAGVAETAASIITVVAALRLPLIVAVIIGVVSVVVLRMALG